MRRANVPFRRYAHDRPLCRMQAACRALRPGIRLSCMGARHAPNFRPADTVPTTGEPFLLRSLSRTRADECCICGGGKHLNLVRYLTDLLSACTQKAFGIAPYPVRQKRCRALHAQSLQTHTHRIRVFTEIRGQCVLCKRARGREQTPQHTVGLLPGNTRREFGHISHDAALCVHGCDKHARA